MRATSVDDPFERGIAHFNAREFFEAHEAWEQIWLRAPAAEKAFLQGIIQISAAFHHYAHGNLRGAESLIQAGIAKIRNYPASYRGIDVARLVGEAEAWSDALREPAGQPRKVPQIHRTK